MTEQLLTLKEAAESLGLSEKDVERLVEKQVISAYNIGGRYLRFKEEQILQLKSKGSKIQDFAFSQKAVKDSARSESLISRLRDFFYFNDFYILSAILIAILVYIILESIR